VLVCSACVDRTRARSSLAAAFTSSTFASLRGVLCIVYCVLRPIGCCCGSGRWCQFTERREKRCSGNSKKERGEGSRARTRTVAVNSRSRRSARASRARICASIARKWVIYAGGGGGGVAGGGGSWRGAGRGEAAGVGGTRGAQ